MLSGKFLYMKNKSARNTLYNSGPCTDPWGSPNITTNHSLYGLFIVVFCFLSERKLWTDFKADQLNQLYYSRLASQKLCATFFVEHLWNRSYQIKESNKKMQRKNVTLSVIKCQKENEKIRFFKSKYLNW